MLYDLQTKMLQQKFIFDTYWKSTSSI